MSAFIFATKSPWDPHKISSRAPGQKNKGHVPGDIFTAYP